MTKNEVAKILEMAFDCYPTAQIKEPERVIETWSKMLEGRNCRQATEAMQRLCVRGKYFPSIADLFQEMGPDWSKVK